MVKIQGRSEYDKLDEIMRRVAAAHGLKLDVVGWSRKTYDLYVVLEDQRTSRLAARIESFVTTSGEIRVFDEGAMPFAEKLGEALEEAFSLEAVIIRDQKPG